jgi:hypothetical protein
VIEGPELLFLGEPATGFDLWPGGSSGNCSNSGSYERGHADLALRAWVAGGLALWARVAECPRHSVGQYALTEDVKPSIGLGICGRSSFSGTSA